MSFGKFVLAKTILIMLRQTSVSPDSGQKTAETTQDDTRNDQIITIRSFVKIPTACGRRKKNVNRKFAKMRIIQKE